MRVVFNLCRLVGFRDFHTIGGIFCCNVFKIYIMRNPNLNVHNQQLLALNTSAGTTTEESFIIPSSSAYDLQQLFDSIEDKARNLQDNIGNKTDLDRGLSQIITIASIASKIIHPEDLQTLDQYLNGLTSHSTSKDNHKI